MIGLVRNSYNCLPRVSSLLKLQSCRLSGKQTGKTRHHRSALSIIMAKQTDTKIKQQDYNYFLVLDFEATCEKDFRIDPQEIIEFPVLKVNGQTFEVESTFHKYVQPRVHKDLSPFCTELTGIIQDMVDGQPHLEDTMQQLNKWMNDEGLFDPNVSSVFVTCGDWDLKTMLPSQCRYFNIKYPAYLKRWINIKRPFSDVVGHWGKGMMGMLNNLNIKHEGRHHSGIGNIPAMLGNLNIAFEGRLHSGIDDCKNIAKILKALAERGYVYKQTGQVH